MNKLLEGEWKEFLKWFNLPSLILGLVIGGIGLMLPKGPWTLFGQASFELNAAEVAGLLFMFGPFIYNIYKQIKFPKPFIKSKRETEDQQS